jgi:hypothetical protein
MAYFLMSPAKPEPPPPPPFDCLIAPTLEVGRCSTVAMDTREPDSAYVWSACPAGFAWNERLAHCHPCPINTQAHTRSLMLSSAFLCSPCHAVAQVVVDRTSGLGKCSECPDGSHNQRPKKFAACSCKPHLEPHGHGECIICESGFYKDRAMGHNEPCVRCPDSKYNHTDLGAKRSSRALCLLLVAKMICFPWFSFFVSPSHSLFTAASKNAGSRALVCFRFVQNTNSQNGKKRPLTSSKPVYQD